MKRKGSSGDRKLSAKEKIKRSKDEEAAFETFEKYKYFILAGAVILLGGAVIKLVMG